MLTPVQNPRIDAINKETSVPLTTKVPISIHPEVLIPHAEELVNGGGVAEQAYRAGREAIKVLHQSLLGMEEAHDAMAVPTNVAKPGLSKTDGPLRPVLKNLVPDNRKAELAAAMNASYERCARSFDKSQQAIRESIDTLTGRIEATIRDPNRNLVGTATAAAQIRDAVRSLPAIERMSALHKAIEDGDRQTIWSVLDAPAIVSGLDRGQHAQLRDFAAKGFAPSEYKQREAAFAVLNKAIDASSLYTQRFVKLSPKLSENPRETSLRKLREEV